MIAGVLSFGLALVVVLFMDFFKEEDDD